MHRLVAATLCLIGLTTTSAAAAASGQASSVVSFESARGDATWKGRVRSEAPACERHRRVAVKKLQPGPDAVVALVRTDASGRYWAHVDVEYTTYYAKVRREKRGAEGLRCKSDRSPSVTIAQADPG